MTVSLEGRELALRRNERVSPWQEEVVENDNEEDDDGEGSGGDKDKESSS